MATRKIRRPRITPSRPPRARHQCRRAECRPRRSERFIAWLFVACPRPPGRVPDVQYLHLVSYPIENLVWVAGDEYHPHIGILSLVTTEWMIFELFRRLADACDHVLRAGCGSLSQIFEYPLAIRKRFGRLAN